MSKDGFPRATFVKDLHEMVRNQIEKKMEQYVCQANKRTKSIVFEPEDWVWVHLRKDMMEACLWGSMEAGSLSFNEVL